MYLTISRTDYERILRFVDATIDQIPRGYIRKRRKFRAEAITSMVRMEAEQHDDLPPVDESCEWLRLENVNLGNGAYLDSYKDVSTAHGIKRVSDASVWANDGTRSLHRNVLAIITEG